MHRFFYPANLFVVLWAFSCNDAPNSQPQKSTTNEHLSFMRAQREARLKREW
jgi:hypothetical protein